MNVICLTNFYPIPAAPARGVFVRRRVQALARAGVSVTVIHPVPTILPGSARLVPRAAQFRGLPEHYLDDGIDVYQPRYFTYPGHLRLGVPDRFQWGPVLRLGLEKPALLHAHFAAPSGLLTRRLARYWGVPYVLTLHGYDVNFWPHHNPVNRRRFRQVCRDAGRVIAVSQDLAGKAAALTGVLAEVLTTGGDLSDGAPAPSRAGTRRRMNLSEDAFVVLYVGNLITAKGMAELCEVAGSMPEARFVVAGSGPWRTRLERLENVTTLGQVPGDEIRALMAASDAFCLPSHSEGMPNVLLEAGAAALPVVATSVGGIPEVIGTSERGLLVPPGDAIELGAAIAAVRSDPAAAAARAAALRGFVREHFDVDRHAQRLKAIYAEVLSRQSGETTR